MVSLEILHRYHYQLEKKHLFWKYLKDRGLISNKKYERLTRSNELTDQELEDFVNRQKQLLIGLIVKRLNC